MGGFCCVLLACGLCAGYEPDCFYRALPQAEIGDVTRFVRRSSITHFAGVDPGADLSGNHESKSVRTAKSGPPELHKALTAC